MPTRSRKADSLWESEMNSVDISRARVQRLIDMDAVPNYVVAELLNEVERLQRSITGAMDHLSNGNVEAGARLLRECFWGATAQTERRAVPLVLHHTFQPHKGLQMCTPDCPACAFQRTGSSQETRALCPHGMSLAENVCGPCSEGRPNRASCDGCGEDATDRCPHCQSTTCGKCATCEHSALNRGAGDV